MTEKTRLEIEAEQSLAQALTLGRQMAAITDALFNGGKLAPKPNPERLQKRCPDCFGTGRVDFFDGETPMTCDLCGGEGMLP